MERRTRETIITVLRPALLVVKFIATCVYKGLFWWYDIVSQKRADQSLWDDLQVNLHFLVSKGEQLEHDGSDSYLLITLPFRSITRISVFGLREGEDN